MRTLANSEDPDEIKGMYGMSTLFAKIKMIFMCVCVCLDLDTPPQVDTGKSTSSLLDGWLRMGLPPPPPREFCRHILSCRELKAESFKRCLHSVLRGVSL